MKPAAKDPFVLQHKVNGTIHQVKKDGWTWCGKRKGDSYIRRRLSKALQQRNARLCNTPGKCGAHQ